MTGSVRILFGVFASILASSQAEFALAAAETYPVRPVRMIVPFSPGSSDVTARLIAQKLSGGLGQQFVVDNRPGASGIIGTNMAAKAPADGYTLLFHTCTLAISTALNKRLPYRVPQDFEAVARLANSPTIVVTNPSLPVSNVKDLIAFTKAKPEALNYGSIGPGSLAYLSAELFKASTGVRMTEVTYQGTAPAVTALIAGEVQLMFSVLGAALPHVRSGKLKAIAMASAQRSPLFPELPTVAESGLPGFDSVCWHGVLAPRGTDRAVVARLNTHIVDAVATSEMRSRLTALGFESVPPSSSPEFANFLSAEVDKWARVIGTAGVQVKD
jgi:tripartite-type tricarboxylate transporter receptor subunit TctC